MERITSSSNAQIKHLRELQTKGKTRKETGTFVAEGRKLVEEACELGLVRQIYVSERYASEQEESGTMRSGMADRGEQKESGTVRLGMINRGEQEKGELAYPGAEYTIVADSVFKTISDTQTPQGILAVVKQPVYSLEALLTEEMLLKRETLRLLVLEDVRDPGNLGTMIRTAEGAGIDAVILSQGTVDLYNPKVVRSTMGSIFRMPYVYEPDLIQVLRRLKEKGITLFAAHLAGRQYYDEIAYPRKAAVLIGNEANGLTEEVAGEADCYVKIPMAGKVESLNAAVAAALLMYQMRKG